MGATSPRRGKTLLAVATAVAATVVAVLAAARGAAAQEPPKFVGLSRNNAVYVGRSDIGADGRIIGGRKVTEDDAVYGARFMVKLLFQANGGNFFYCGGALINPNKVLTAAHCIDGFDVVADGDVVRIGGLTINSGFQRRITRAAIHPRYNRNTLNYDVAVLTFADPPSAAEYRSAGVRRAILNGYRTRPTTRQQLYVAGWGRTSGIRENSLSQDLRIAAVKADTWSSCSAYFQRFQNFALDPRGTYYQYCASTYDKSASCNGDSGSPMFERLISPTGYDYYKLYGIVSYGYPGRSGENVCPAQNPDFYARVSAGLSFIKSEM